MFIDGEVRSIATLGTVEIAHLARLQAERGEPCAHNYQPGTREAAIWERHHADRCKDLEERELFV